MAFSVHLQRSAVVAIVNCSVNGQFNGLRSLKQDALQSIWLFQESLSILWYLLDGLLIVQAKPLLDEKSAERQTCLLCKSTRRGVELRRICFFQFFLRHKQGQDHQLIF